jgi:hypothetical protein
MKLVFYEHQ